MKPTVDNSSSSRQVVPVPLETFLKNTDMRCLLAIPLALVVLGVAGAEYTVTVHKNEEPAKNELQLDTGDKTDAPQTESDFWINYIIALRNAQLAKYWNSYNDYYNYNVVPLQPRPVYMPYVPIRPATPAKEKCKQIGEPCVYHEDCCSFACLTYLARCVSG